MTLPEDKLEEFEAELRGAKIDTDDSLATIDRVWVGEVSAADRAPAGRTPGEGLLIRLRRTSGTAFTRWFEAPDSWEPHWDLVALLSFLGYDPEDDNPLGDLEGRDVPVRFYEGEGWRLDWEMIADGDLPDTVFHD